MFWPVLAIAALGWWLLLPLAFFALFILYLIEGFDKPRFGLSFFLLLLLAIGLVGFTDLGVWAWVKANPLSLVYGVLGFIGTGVLWTFPRWGFFFVPERAEDYARRRESLQAEYASWARDRSNPLTYAEWLRRPGSGYNFPPQALENKARITGWMAYWPLDLLYCVFHKMLKRIWNYAYEKFSGIYNALANRQFAKFEEIK